MISVCMATYNGGRFVKQQLLSILPQIGHDDEVIISDDGSTDNTLEEIQSLQSPQIKIIKNKGAHGYTSNFENALRHAAGDFIFLSDQDDLWAKDKVERCLEHFHTYDLIISDATLINDKGGTISPSFFKLRGSKAGLLNNLVRFSFLGCCMAFKRKVLSKALPFPPNHKLCTHDNWITLVGMSFFKTLVTPEPLIAYRRYGGNASTGGMKNTTSFAFKLEYRLYLMRWLLIRSLSSPHQVEEP